MTPNSSQGRAGRAPSSSASRPPRRLTEILTCLLFLAGLVGLLYAPLLAVGLR